MMRIRLAVALLLALAVAVCGCTRKGESNASPGKHLLQPYQGSLLPSDALTPTPGAINVTYLGASTLLFDDGETQVLIDPFISEGGTAVKSPDRALIDVTLRQVNASRVKAILVSRMDDRIRDATYIARKTGATLFGATPVLAAGQADGIPAKQLASSSAGIVAHVGKFQIEEIASRPAPAPKGRPAAVRGEHASGYAADFVLRKGSRSILIKPSANFIPGALHHIDADVLFLATGTLGEQTPFFQDLYYQQTVGETHPGLVIPIQWDDDTQPLSRSLAPTAVTTAAFDFLMPRLRKDKIRFGLLQGYQTTELFTVRSCAIPMPEGK